MMINGDWTNDKYSTDNLLILDLVASPYFVLTDLPV